MLKTLFIAAAAAASIGVAGAQQPPVCKAFYELGEAAPAGCVKAADKWGDGSAVTPSAKSYKGDAYERTYFPTQPPASTPRAGPR